MRAPVTSIIIIFEMTNNYSIILPLMVANIISYAVAYEISPTPIYDALLRQDGIRLPHEERELLKQIPVSAAMTTHVVTLDGQQIVATAFHYLQSLPDAHLAYPVINQDGRLTGLLTYNDLKRALADSHDQLLLAQLPVRKFAPVYPDQTMQAALVKLGRDGLSLLPVVSRTDKTRILGVITTHDIARRLSGAEPQAEEAWKE